MADKNSWLFDPPVNSGDQMGGDPFSTMLHNELQSDRQQGGSLTLGDLFIREALANSQDQKVKNSNKPANIFLDVITLDLKDKQNFLESIDWPSLSLHIGGCLNSVEGDITVLKDLKRGLANINDHLKPLILVRVSDYNCNGLIGDDVTKGTNFHRYCKATFKSSSSDDGRQGSYGLGKSVFYQNSDIKTAIISSTTEEDGELIQKTFGRCQLPSHDVNQPGTEAWNTLINGVQSWHGPGFFGIEKQPLRPFAGQNRNTNESQLRNAWLERDQTLGTGTTTISIAFNEHGAELGAGEALSSCFKTSIWKHFWPALCVDNPEAKFTIREFRNGNPDVPQSIEEISLDDSTANSWLPFAKCHKDIANSNNVDSPENIMLKQYPVDLPAISNDPDSIATQMIGDIKIYNSSITPMIHGMHGHVALLRNKQTVVSYLKVPEMMSDQNKNLYAVFNAGKARGNSAEDIVMHNFLRLAEPPLHNNWKYTKKVGEDYELPGGARNFLSRLTKGIQDSIAAEVSELEIIDTENLDLLSSFFDFGSSVTSVQPKERTYDVINITPNLEAHEITYLVNIENTSDDYQNAWHSRLTTKIIGSTAEFQPRIRSIQINDNADDISFEVIKNNNGDHLKVIFICSKNLVDFSVTVIADLPKIYSIDELKSKIALDIDVRKD